ncbi:MAG: Rv3235 family protein [Bifidobacteriaceae bacterium]|jgi:hypothetical protein|nr:Rv3235 family protein [Bifidobacteriaceae bacterium]
MTKSAQIQALPGLPPPPGIGPSSRSPSICATFIATRALAALDGYSPTRELTRFVSKEVWQQLKTFACRLPGQHRTPEHMRVHLMLSKITPRIIEATLVCHQADQIRTVAMRLLNQMDAWQASELIIID